MELTWDISDVVGFCASFSIQMLSYFWRLTKLTAESKKLMTHKNRCEFCVDRGLGPNYKRDGAHPRPID